MSVFPVQKTVSEVAFSSRALRVTLSVRSEGVPDPSSVAPPVSVP
jgi:hypothetical protein